jgi:hypothetical protein
VLCAYDRQVVQREWLPSEHLGHLATGMVDSFRSRSGDLQPLVTAAAAPFLPTTRARLVTLPPRLPLLLCG